MASLKNRIEELEKIFSNLAQLNKMLTKNGLNVDNLKQVGHKLEEILNNSMIVNLTGANNMETEGNNDFESLIKKYGDENEKLKTKCQDLENCIDLLRNEYEKCEDYWQSKLDEERQIFEQEQSQSSEKLSDLINKMSEYEEQFANQDETDGRLPTIDETYNLEQQFTDLEQEFEDYKTQSQSEMSKRDTEIKILKDKLTELASKQMQEKGVQVENVKLENLSLCMVETTNLFSADAMPTWTSDDNINKVVWNKEGDDNSTVSWANGPTSSNSSEKNSAPCRPKRTRKHERNNCLYKKTSDGRKTDEDTRRDDRVIALPIATVHNLNGRLHHLEQRCHQLQMVLRQQHFYTEQSLQREYSFNCKATFLLLWFFFLQIQFVRYLERFSFKSCSVKNCKNQVGSVENSKGPYTLTVRLTTIYRLPICFDGGSQKYDFCCYFNNKLYTICQSVPI